MNKTFILLSFFFLFHYPSFAGVNLDKKILTHIYNSLCLAEENALKERLILISEHDKMHLLVSGFPKLEAKPMMGPKTPLEIINSIIQLSVSKMHFENKELEKLFYIELENDRKRLKSLFWKYAVTPSFSKKEIVSFVKKNVDKYKSETSTSCELNDSQKSRLLMEIY